MDTETPGVVVPHIQTSGYACQLCKLGQLQLDYLNGSMCLSRRTLVNDLCIGAGLLLICVYSADIAQKNDVA